jgi:spore coat protein U-like protein
MFVKCKRQLLVFGLFIVLSQFSVIARANCNVSTSVLSFVAYDFIAISSNDSTSQLRILCDQNIPYAIKLDAGLNAGGDYSRRQMRSAQGNTPLLYNIYLDASYSQVWGDGRGFSTFYQGLSSGTSVILPLFGRIPSRQPVEAGIYTDSVVITVEW